MKYYEDPILGKGRAADVTGGTGGESYVAGDGIAINGNTISATGGGGVSESEFDGTQTVSKDVTEARHIPGLSGTPLTLLHFSDIHDDSAALGRIMADKTALGSLVDDAICTGDIVANTGMSISSWWNSSVMTCIGNHDTATYSAGTGYDWTAVSMAQRDSWYIAPFESNWSITHTSGTSYYYKDYSTQKVRLIVVDVMLYMSDTTSTEAATQTSWLSSLLADAIANSLHVLIAIHAPHGGSVRVKCSFSKYGQGTMPTNTDCNTPDTIINTVASAITSGLHFIGYLVGHTHQDDVWDATGDGKQLMYCVTCASVNLSAQWKNSDMTRDTSLDAYNLVTVDTENTIVKITRGGGANIDNRMRPRESISVNYTTGEITDYTNANHATNADTAENANYATNANTATTALGVANSAAGWRQVVTNGSISAAQFVPTELVNGGTMTLEAGHAYECYVLTGSTLSISADAAIGSYGLDGIIDLHLNGGTVTFAENAILTSTLPNNTRNVCSVKFIDGLCVISVLCSIPEGSQTGYLVTKSSGTDNGSLYYGIATSNENTIHFAVSVIGHTVPTGNAVANGSKNIIGNGVSATAITGSMTCSATTLSNLTASDVVIDGGSISLAGHVRIDGTLTAIENSPLIISSGAIVDFTGNTNTTPIVHSGGTIEFPAGGATVYPYAGSAAAFALGSATIGSITNGGIVSPVPGSTIAIRGYASGVTFTDDSQIYTYGSSNTVYITDCTASLMRIYAGNNVLAGNIVFKSDGFCVRPEVGNLTIEANTTIDVSNSQFGGAIQCKQTLTIGSNCKLLRNGVEIPINGGTEGTWTGSYYIKNSDGTVNPL